MEIMVLGLLLWSSVHLMPSLAQPVKKIVIHSLGETGYKIAFAVLIVISLVLIVYGWRHTIPDYIYALPIVVKPIAVALMLVAFILFGAAKYPTRIKSYIRNPQLTSVIVWSVAHLLANGDSRSIVLFSWMGTWALLEIIFINRREGIWVKQSVPSWPKELRGVAISLVVFVVVIFIHPYIAGVSLK
ncbi:NnrU family protein [Pseudomonadota bacterium]